MADAKDSFGRIKDVSSCRRRRRRFHGSGNETCALKCSHIRMN